MILKSLWPTVILALSTGLAGAQVPDNLVMEGIPAISAELRGEVGRYLEFRSATFSSWHPVNREMLIGTRFADVTQIHRVKMPGGSRQQLTFGREPASGARFQPRIGNSYVFSQDAGGGEFFQLFRFDLTNGQITLLTDGKSRNTGHHWSPNGEWLAFASTRRNGRDNDLYVLNPADPKSARLVLEVSGGGWSVLDWAKDGARLLVGEYVSINESRLYVVDVQSGEKTLITPNTGAKVSYGNALFARDGKSVYTTTDKDSEFQRLCKIDLVTREITVVTPVLTADVEDFDLSSDGRLVAWVTNEDGASVLHLTDLKDGKASDIPRLPLGVISGLSWHENGRDLAFTFSSARSPNDVYSLDAKTGKLERWTESETGGLNPEQFVEPELLKWKSFDGLDLSAFLYRPSREKFSGARPVIIYIHGGPEGQSRPTFQARNNYYLNEMGIAIIYPNVRGSEGYGKTFLTLDNGFKREDSVKDIGSLLDEIRRDTAIDGKRIAVLGGSYGGYMVLASMTHYNDVLRCGVDVVGISNFLTFLKNTQDYRRDLRRVEYGDERDPKMAEFLERISPQTNAKKITKPLFVVQGKNDPRVPFTESEQMVQAIRANGGPVWNLMAKEEGHGFQKKRNADEQFFSTILFFRENLLNSPPLSSFPQ